MRTCLCRRALFFFQAEDGIRDADVTGVQTCALPISLSTSSSFSNSSKVVSSIGPTMAARTCAANSGLYSSASSRSEERRVGKGVDLGGRRGVKKKKQCGLDRETADVGHRRAHRGCVA